MHLTLIFGFLADAHLQEAEVDAGLAAADEGLRIAEQNAESYHAAELHRLRGELLQIRSPSATADVEKEFLLALDVAHEQEARALELRAAISLARLWQRQGRGKKGYELLAPIYGWFSEGLDTKDLRQAATLMQELQQA